MVKEYCARHSIRTWGATSQAEKDALVIAAHGLTGFRPTIRDRLVLGSEFLKKALEALLQDCLKKCSETTKNLAIKRMRKRAQPDVVSNGDDEVPDSEIKPIAVLFWVADPDIWDECARRKIAEIRLITLDGIWDMVKAYVPAGRKVREIIGALADPTPPNLTFPADYMSLNTDAEANPVHLLVILHTLPPRANIPPPGAAYFELEKFAPPTEYNDYAEDSDAIVRNAAGVSRRRIPIRDHTFEERKYELCARIKCQQDIKIAVKAKHQRLFPNAGIIDSSRKIFPRHNAPLGLLTHSSDPSYTWSPLVPQRLPSGISRYNSIDCLLTSIHCHAPPRYPPYYSMSVIRPDAYLQQFLAILLCQMLTIPCW
ncbi:hypothetical protein L211DRAFT_854441 [Terfezia boudieri ATCC MYA-4762]|uniref:Uncharacterized protein n=1 Tax=Terfezia boudieri ATCC MYA-4762 TaxID=1051890 RepID=A0A3N4L5D5_9PEZI|nr:hypothetical protein L211DRAFT_854441 [Terfezia boudieri ATCC MYA-4762]